MSRSANLAEHDFEDDVAYRALDYTGLDLSGRAVRSLEVEECRFTDCDMANIHASQATVAGCTLHNSRLTGSKWPEGVFRDVVFSSCRIDLSSFRFATFRRTVFRDCNLREADFQDADLRRVRFEACDLRGAQFANAQLGEAKFTDCHLLGIGGVTSLRGATVDSDDLGGLAYSLAAALGIKIADRG
ncbi:hypothetical protein ALI144C_14990 [Actinosynnema sp. ALI-1.44]|uniref:pentapeptide repeat-containing protein n=1 Tax=Actinosynnema sp. ALI-1.44 TaxID=1933779 RepID=UPI00097C72C5|nr:pentapeptide repeat-containing protein [Actinosynnema sp. ALI-1.44]ONI84455.1 hypothetical protein ALI144C_14990 [Actinosynnema sp. ALI-1.44]